MVNRSKIQLAGCVLMLVSAFTPWNRLGATYALQSFAGLGLVMIFLGGLALFFYLRSRRYGSKSYKKTTTAGFCGGLGLAWCFFIYQQGFQYHTTSMFAPGIYIACLGSLACVLGAVLPVSVDQFFQRKEIGWLAQRKNIEALLHLDEDDDLDDQIVSALASIGPAAVKPLLQALPTKPHTSRAVRALGLIGDARAVAPLASLLRSSNPYHSRLAEEALEKISGAEAQVVLGAYRAEIAAQKATQAEREARRPKVTWKEIGNWVQCALGEMESSIHEDREMDRASYSHYVSLTNDAGKQLYDWGGIALLRSTYEQIRSYNAPIAQTQHQVSVFLKHQWGNLHPEVKTWKETVS